MVVKPLRRFAKRWARVIGRYGAPVRFQLTNNPDKQRSRGNSPKFFEPITDQTLGEALPQKKMRPGKPQESTIFIQKRLRGSEVQKVIAHEIGHATHYSGNNRKEVIHPVNHPLSDVFSIISEMEYAKRHDPKLFQSFMSGNRPTHPSADEFVRQLFQTLRKTKDRRTFMTWLRSNYHNNDFAIMDLHNFAHKAEGK